MTEHTKKTIETRTIDGVEALVNVDPEEIFIDLPASNPRYIRVQEGDRIQEGDVGTQSTAEMAGPLLTHWVVESITEETVIGRDTETNETREWDREQLVQRLGIGGLSAELSTFDRVSVTELEEWRGRHTSEGSEEVKPYVVVIAYGNNGGKFTQLYAATEAGDWDSLEVVQQDSHVQAFSDELRTHFDDAVREALEVEQRYH
ncbi:MULTISPECIES: hypothetical protein [unclassified Haloferax]|uniref:Uncharacterized protein n=2 Tax=unclassified Haloferax TaxID=2625095 RepID=A0ACD5I0F2_9EURY|nr:MULTISPECIES: hypothetical protein [unclassified Haloferax]RLM33530.1 hypothetical protein DVK03_17770 [Haloferax sp. Atlit-109R]RDZ30283.1 hypothetical protein DEQ67_14525 [Haloferax sp. Atlit-48N]RDZ33925.1 hypothetical protein C5B88_14705 [Haloferax sp. Atlit-24N]RDZ35611.1 hypothetical protein C5B89_17885 [Haloferax sp. Atlit-47N]RLM40892.1 hypothetical protein DVK04_18550 [Haloferax sp. Atlit-105R]